MKECHFKGCFGKLTLILAGGGGFLGVAILETFPNAAARISALFLFLRLPFPLRLLPLTEVFDLRAPLPSFFLLVDYKVSCA